MTTISPSPSPIDRDDVRRSEARAATRAIRLLPVAVIATGTVSGPPVLLPLLLPPLDGLDPTTQISSVGAAVMLAVIIGIGQCILAGIGAVVGAMIGRRIGRHRPVLGASIGAGIGTIAAATVTVSNADGGPTPLLWVVAVLGSVAAAVFVRIAARVIQSRNPF